MYALNPELFGLSSEEYSIIEEYVRDYSDYDAELDGKESSLKRFLLCSYLRYRLSSDYRSILLHWCDIDRSLVCLDDPDWVTALASALRDIAPFDEEAEAEFRHKPLHMLRSLLHAHAMVFRMVFAEAIQAMCGTKQVFDYVDMYHSFLSRVIGILRRFPDNEEIVAGWNAELLLTRRIHAFDAPDNSVVVRNESVLLN